MHRRTKSRERNEIRMGRVDSVELREGNGCGGERLVLVHAPLHARPAEVRSARYKSVARLEAAWPETVFADFVEELTHLVLTL